MLALVLVLPVRISMDARLVLTITTSILKISARLVDLTACPVWLIHVLSALTAMNSILTMFVSLLAVDSLGGAFF